jgi:hypothetical protein
MKQCNTCARGDARGTSSRGLGVDPELVKAAQVLVSYHDEPETEFERRVLGAPSSLRPVRDPKTQKIKYFVGQGSEVSMKVDTAGNIVERRYSGVHGVKSSLVQPLDLIDIPKLVVGIGGAAAKLGVRAVGKLGAKALSKSVSPTLLESAAEKIIRPGSEELLNLTAHQLLKLATEGEEAVRLGMRSAEARLLQRETRVVSGGALRELSGKASVSKLASAELREAEKAASAGLKRTIQGVPKPRLGQSLVGSSESQMSRAAAKIISEDKDHPLKFLLDQSRRLKFRPQKGLTHAELIDRPDLVQMGHLMSKHIGGKRVVIQSAWLNQFLNLTLERSSIGGAVLEQEAIDIGGVAVEKRTAQFWEDINWLDPGTVENAPKVL